ncbi:RtcB family protein [Heliorestis convoluta]|uniref:3'-phosphate/5'-hydroxy nucleic acid ligase n=1 Tax=Heliorestis convoluta TaxID=356322 RepID=A0A5Q2N994_9FIRM|nr:RtcB family protein [Heliorestis convoluta]QGG48840.1 hypothetical protein FTV88_2751 [Heliorestis convoluta]
MATTTANSDLAHLPLDSQEGMDYLEWMNLALAFAQENRLVIMAQVQEVLSQYFSDLSFEKPINAHHNYAALENHFNRDLVVYRKGSIRVAMGELGIIPGAMGMHSYIVRGHGQAKALHSCSHGAGRILSRKGALKAYSPEQVMKELSQRKVILGKRKQGIILSAYIPYVTMILANFLQLTLIKERGKKTHLSSLILVQN